MAQTHKAHPTADTDPDFREVRDFHLTMDEVSKYASATTNLKKLADSTPGLKESMESENDEKNIGDMVRGLEKYPQAVTAIRSAGMSSREYVVMSMTLMQTVIAVGLKKQGLGKEYPAGTINPQNVAFVEQNYDKLRKLLEDASGNPPEKNESGGTDSDDSQ